MKFSPKKTLGQHFLLNPSTIDKIIEKAGVLPTDRVLEIGTGPGIMTQRLVARTAKVIAVEKDSRFAQSLRKKFAGHANLTLIEADFLTLDLDSLFLNEEIKWKVIANLPYNVATPIIFQLLDARRFFTSLHLMVQREVAERLAAKPGSKDYGRLSISSQLYSENKIIMRLPPGAFTPPPKVHSAVVGFQLHEHCRFPIEDVVLFKRVVEAAFGQRRKMIRNSLSAGLPQFGDLQIQKALKEAKIASTARAETVPIEKFARLAGALCDCS